ncbi:unnamed protein product, partial [Symbiodinium sp. KB8]
ATPTVERMRSLSTPAFSPAKTSPPKLGKSAWARAPLRRCNEPVPRPSKGKTLSKTASSASTTLSTPGSGKENRPARLLFSPAPRNDWEASTLSSAPLTSQNFFCDDLDRLPQPDSPLPAAPGWWPEPDSPPRRTRSLDPPARGARKGVAHRLGI